VKVGDLVKYRIYPHETLGRLLGLVQDTEVPGCEPHVRGIYVVWNQDRNRGPANTIMFEYIDELEVVNEGR
jgi:hypothetical protein